MKKKHVYLIIIGIIIVVIVGLLRVFNGGEDNWIKDSRGVYIKHGVPRDNPNYVLEQQEIINCAKGLYLEESLKGTVFNSQCLGVCKDYAVDVVHVPRSDIDNLVENQCADFRSGKVSHFIELDSNGDVVRVV